MWWGTVAGIVLAFIGQLNRIDPLVNFPVAFAFGLLNWLIWRPGGLGPRWNDRAKKRQDERRRGQEKGPPTAP